MCAACQPGQLVFGESFDAVKNGRPNPWVSVLLDSVYGSSLLALRKRSFTIKLVLAAALLLSKSTRDLIADSKQHAQFTLEKVRKRIQMGDTGVPDFFAHILKEGGLSEMEMVSEAMVLVTGGAETSATASIACGKCTLIIWLTLSLVTRSLSTSPRKCMFMQTVPGR